MSTIDIITDAYRATSKTFLNYVPNTELKEALSNVVNVQIEATKATNTIMTAIIQSMTPKK